MCCHGNAVKDFGTLQDNIQGYVCLLLYIFPLFLTGLNNQQTDTAVLHVVFDFALTTEVRVHVAHKLFPIGY